MAFERYIDGFDQCKPPVCEDDFSVDILQVDCMNNGTIEVIWIINDFYERDLYPNLVDCRWWVDNETPGSSVQFSQAQLFQPPALYRTHS